jgi:ATP synthase protein I
MFDDIDNRPEIRTLSKQEAAVVKASNPTLNPWRVVGWQLMAVVASGLLALAFTQKWSVVSAVVWGGLSVVIPAAVFARGMMSKTTLLNAGTATGGFFLWELVKIALTLAMLYAAPQVMARLGQDLSWPAMLAGLVVVMKVYWLALLCKPKVKLEVRLAKHN